MAFFDDSELSELKIERMIFHLVGPKNGLIKLEEVDPGEFESFFVDRIRSVNGGLPYAFSDASSTRERLGRIASNAGVFQEESEKLAEDFQAYHGGTAAEGAILLFVLKAKAMRSFALLKYDDETVIAYDLKDDGGGRKKVSLEALQKTFVQNKAALQKAALIKLTEKGGELTVLDRRNQQKVAQYFEAFLGARQTLSDAELTKKLVDVTRKVIGDNPDLVDGEVVRELTKRTYDAASGGGEIDSEDHRSFLETVIGHKLADDSVLLSKFNRSLTTERISGVPMTLVPDQVKGPKTLHFKTENGIEIRVPNEFRALIEKTEDGMIIIHDKLAVETDDPN
ncbi:nucleoid-associated protein [Rhizobium sp. P40RR-XXII]|uniref:nucleoid-associated protein n=1 Tax=unclassified Rhizobium TaxID=2613769 RepID=UPI0014573EDC|nr:MULTISPECIES: nucleoid-associated protein [unclassified Rhizobium]NLR84858.1 nucleoid-associated protein [Rhizobium sp. P28RR-XV]NLS16235.1 nucleoid-associated protein [Rhizobium sp. P40RR-XXII]